MAKRQDICQYGSATCTYTQSAELAFAQRIMAEIGRALEDEQLAACPLCLRDTMLSIAALLHLEAAKLSMGTGKPDGDRDAIKEFVAAARRQFGAAADASLIAQAIARKH